ncbi:hypothetical protein PYCC9005_005232 [Savitreella phatthalungensis]
MVLRIAAQELEQLKECVRNRRPCVLTNLPEDFDGLRSLLSLGDLSARAGNVEVDVEPISSKGTFGTSETKRRMTISSLVQALERGERLYLTTQYEDAEDDQVLHEPLRSMWDDLQVPVSPRIVNDLVTAKINLWLGASREGTSSGLHHDFHDNLYVLLSGAKTFRVIPPSKEICERVGVTPLEIYDNGLISYSEDLQPDGMTTSARLDVQIAILESKTRTQAVEDDLETLYERRLELSLADVGHNDSSIQDSDEHDEDEVEDDEDDQDEDVNDNFGKLKEGGDDDQRELANGVKGLREEREEETDEESPPSFSHLTSSQVKQLVAEVGEEIDLKAGECLYLPASYFHEVISQSSTDAFHMAVNWWFYPPDNDEGGYSHSSIMDYLRQTFQDRYSTTRANMHNAQNKRVKKS